MSRVSCLGLLCGGRVVHIDIGLSAGSGGGDLQVSEGLGLVHG